MKIIKHNILKLLCLAVYSVFGFYTPLWAMGEIDTTFASNIEPSLTAVYPIVVQPDGKIMIGGTFTGVDGTSRNRIARLNSNGSLDTGFNPGTGADAYVASIALQSDGRIVIGGTFTYINGLLRNGIARLNTDGSSDSAFISSGTNNTVNVVALQPDNKILLGGYFTLVNAASRNYIARLNNNGSLDTGFNSSSGPDSWVDSLKVQPDGKILIAGDFTIVNGTSRDHIARLNTDGSLDTSFAPGTGADSWVYSIAIQPDGKIIIAGAFISINGISRNHIARLNADGSLDTSFAPTINDVIYFITLQSDGKILISGDFTSINAITRNNIARLNSDGSLDTAFASGSPDNSINSITIQPDGNILVGGFFDYIDTTSCKEMVRLIGSVPPPLPPTALTATAISQTQISLSWTDNSINETGFKIFRNSSLITTTTANATIYSDTGLICGTTYNYEVRANNSTGDSSGITASAATQDCTPTVTAGASIVSVSNITAITALATGTATGDGISEWGFYWWNNNDSSGLLPASSSPGNFSLTLTGLKPNTSYNVRAYVKAGAQIISSDVLTFTTRTPQNPVVHTSSIFVINGFNVDVSGEITDVGSSPVLIYGFVYTNHPAPTVLDRALAIAWDPSLPLSVGKPFSGTIQNLAPGTYYLRSYAHNDAGTAYGEEITFTIYAPGFTVSPTSGLTTSENGTSATFTIKPNTQPTANVTLSLSSSDTTEGIISSSSLTFTPQNWNIPQTVIIIGVDDSIADGNQSYKISFSPAISTDSAYNGLKPDDVSVINTDNDVPGFTVTPISGNTSENGDSATFGVRLNSQPVADVTINLDSSDTTEGTVSPANLTFTSHNWSVFQIITVTGVDDTVIDGDQSYKISFSPAISTNSVYNGLKPNDVSVVNLDNDLPPPINHAPVANADNYQTNQDTSLNIAAPGVLANDSDADSDTLTALNNHRL